MGFKSSCEDAISRQAAINALDENIGMCDKALGSFGISMRDEYAVKVEKASLVAYKEQLESLPSVQTERKKGEWIYPYKTTTLVSICSEQEGKEMNEKFLVDSISEITEEHFKATCMAAMMCDTKSFGLLGVECSAEEFLLYIGRDKAIVTVRNWSKMLTLHIVSESGTWLVSSHIEGMGVEGNLEEAWRQFKAVKDYIKTKPEMAFKDVGFRWIDGGEKYMEYIKEIVNE